MAGRDSLARRFEYRGNMIPAWLVALSAFFCTVVIFTVPNGVRIPIKIFSLSTILQFTTYLAFAFLDVPIETRQFIGRLNTIGMSLALSIIIISVRVKYGN